MKTARFSTAASPCIPGAEFLHREDVLELQGHGGRVVLESLRERVIALGARQARPGEFSERRVLNGKIDLVQAEAIADLIDADSRQAARSAPAHPDR